MNAEELLTSLERRGFQVRLVDGTLRVDPFPKLTPAERASIAEVARDKAAKSTLERLLREREETRSQGLPPSDARLIDRVIETFPGSTLVEIRPGVPTTPARTKRVRKAAVDKRVVEARTADDSTTTEQANPADAEKVRASQATREVPEQSPLFASDPPPSSEQPTADPVDDPEHNSDQSSAPCEAEVSNPSSQEPANETETPEIVWTIGLTRDDGRQNIYLRPSRSTADSGRQVLYSIEETIWPDEYMLVPVAQVPRSGVQLVRRAEAIWRVRTWFER